MGLLIVASLVHARPAGTFRTALGKSTLALLIPFLIAALISEDLARGWKEWTSLWPLLFPFLGAAASDHDGEVRAGGETQGGCTRPAKLTLARAICWPKFPAGVS